MASRSALHHHTLRPETNKRPGVFYVITRDGVELPVVDVTHPAFAISITDSEQMTLVEKFLHDGIPLAEAAQASARASPAGSCCANQCWRRELTRREAASCRECRLIS